ncbi:MAG: CBS domain-containing protein, partial [Candidatus Micrarchaeota archaeon]|nr:CBS domain-containing protein [Candidatus Micrarchaeota archaeon]
LTQLRLSRATGVPQSVISKLEAGKLDPSYSSAARLFEYFTRAQETRGKTAAQLMHAPIVGLRPSDKIREAMNLMQRHAISTLPVLQEGRLVGHVSDDLILEHSAKGRDVSSWPVSQVMGEPLPRIAEGTPAELVRQLLLHSKAVVVTRGERAVGIITKADLLKLLR